ncbi:MAG: IclR family transcriptional regulator [Halodesulfovibrio sp.]
MKLNRTTLRATEVLKLLADAPEGMTLSEIGAALDLPKASAFDIVQTLRQTHFLREANKRFSIGFMAREVGEAYDPHRDLFGIVKPHLVGLADALKMAGSLVQYEKDGLNYVFEHRPLGSIISPGASSGMDFVHASASGKVLIAFMTEAKRKKALSGMRFTRFTDRTITSMDAFVAELEKVKRLGYGVDDREFNGLMTCISTPIFSRNQAVAAITLSGLQIDPQSVSGIAERIMNTARIIANELGRD